MYFTQTHDWIKVDGMIATIGISDFAQKELGDAVYIELPIIGRHIHAGDEVVVIESTKAAVDIYTPASGEIIAVNETLRESPEKINQLAESEGWLFKLHLSKPSELQGLMDKTSYTAYISI